MRVGEQEIARLARWFEADAHLSERAAAEALAACEARLAPRQSALDLDRTRSPICLGHGIGHAFALPKISEKTKPP